MTTVAQVLKNKNNSEITTISPEATVLEAITLMANKGIGAVVVVSDTQVTGILSERDYTRKIALMQRTSNLTTVAEIMTSKVLSISSSNTVDECLALMTDRHIRHLPVIDHDKLVGLVSIGDLVKATMDDQKVLIEQLQQYISG
ncbi:MAG: CBS domain-containing protein [Candidatus Acinetobacter avistercoris]|uniref:CBS domain-containing protein n=1 Tax=Acinetobacter sp. KS-LM10 TaxID=3120518 RepID=UPI001F9DB845|nr:CBS domain-containing protein [Candidatus Acinetobacter avistercoris]